MSIITFMCIIQQLLLLSSSIYTVTVNTGTVPNWISCELYAATYFNWYTYNPSKTFLDHIALGQVQYRAYSYYSRRGICTITIESLGPRSWLCVHCRSVGFNNLSTLNFRLNFAFIVHNIQFRTMIGSVFFRLRKYTHRLARPAVLRKLQDVTRSRFFILGGVLIRFQFVLINRSARKKNATIVRAAMIGRPT